MNITINLDTTIEHKTFAGIIHGLVSQGVMFECKVTGTKAVITLTGGF